MENKVSNINFKAFMTDNAQTNCNIVMQVYGDKDPIFPMIGRECTCLFHWSSNLDKTI